MADSETVPQIKILKNSKILVNVEEVIQDILVVSYAIESKLYEGVLLDSTKKSLPCGSVAAASLAGLYSVAAATAAGSPRDGDEDRLYSVGQRFSYCGVVAGAGAGSGAQGGAGVAAPFHLRRAVRPPARYKTSRMTVRLRPRQVLCSKCRSICNENSENVDLSAAGAGGRRRGSARLAGAGAGGGPGAPPGAGGGGDPGAEDPAATVVVETRRPSPRPLFSENQRDNQPRMGSPPGQGDGKLCTTTLIPKLSRLQSSDIPASGGGSGGGGGTHKIKLVGGYWARHVDPAPPPPPPPLCARPHHPPSKLPPPPPPPPVPALPPPPPPPAAACSPARHPLPAPPPPPPSPAAAPGLAPPSPAPSPDGADGDADDSDVQVCGGAGGRMVLRKKRSVGSMEDLWDESVFEAEAKRARAAPSPAFALGPAPPATPVIKISFGRQGEGGTVLKIPSRARSLSVGGAIGGLGLMGGGGGGGAGGGGSSSPAGPGDDASASAKAAKKALKKAKREARRKLLGAGVPGPNSSPAYDALYPRRRKHKVKHKKKHRDERRHAREGSVEVVEVAAAAAAAAAAVAAGAGADVHECPDAESVVGGAVGGGGDSYSAIKERCLKQKLSISLKRLNANAYMRCDAAAAAAAAVAVAAAAGGGGGGGGGSSPSAHVHGHAHSPSRSSSCSNSEEESLAVPDFPAPAAPAPLLLPAVASCLTADGRRMAVGDVVWGKIHGFPWWPGKVLSITLAHKEDGGAPTPQAHVAWYGSSTSSLMPCDQLSPFLETFKARYNKKKRGPYKEAIRQATSEARRDRHLPVDGTVSMAASPREKELKHEIFIFSHTILLREDNFEFFTYSLMCL